MKRLTFGTVVVTSTLVIVMTVGFFSFVGNAVTPQLPIFTGCTKEARQCPDGSTIGRVPPSCEFAACPTVTPEAVAATERTLCGMVGKSMPSLTINVSSVHRCQNQRTGIAYLLSTGPDLGGYSQYYSASGRLLGTAEWSDVPVFKLRNGSYSHCRYSGDQPCPEAVCDQRVSCE